MANSVLETEFRRLKYLLYVKTKSKRVSDNFIHQHQIVFF